MPTDRTSAGRNRPTKRVRRPSWAPGTRRRSCAAAETNRSAEFRNRLRLDRPTRALNSSKSIRPVSTLSLSLNLQHLKCFDELTLIHSSSTSRVEFFISFKKEMDITEVVSFTFFFSRIHEVSK